MHASDVNTFDRRAALTRSLLGYGVLAGVFYLAVGLSLALGREGFDLARHPLSLLMLGEGGWMQRVNLMASGLMAVAAGIGLGRATTPSPGRAKWGSRLVIVYGASVFASGIAAPDPMGGFPPGLEVPSPSPEGMLHLAFGAVGFLALAVAAWSMARWYAVRDKTGLARISRVGGAVVLAGLVAGGALATSPVGIASLWLAVVGGWSWLALVSAKIYRSVPHPDGPRG